MQTNPIEFMAELNAIVKNVWDTKQPKTGGVLRPMPHYLERDGRLVISKANWSVRVRNPVYNVALHGLRLEPRWNHPAWHQVAAQVAVLLGVSVDMSEPN